MLIYTFFRKELTGKFFRNESHEQLLGNGIQPLLLSRLFLWSHMVSPCKIRCGRHRLEKAVIKIKGLIMDSLITDPANLCIPSVKSHRYYSASQFVTQHPEVKVKFKRYIFHLKNMIPRCTLLT